MSNENRFPALRVKQWLEEWNTVTFTPDTPRRRPEPHFYLFSMPAPLLRRLSDVYRRQADRPRKEDLAIQRKHVPDRSEEIRQFIHGGFPWSELPKHKRESLEFANLRMPGWLPTAIVVNILGPDSRRHGKTVAEEDLVRVEEADGGTTIVTPASANSDAWAPDVRPIEIIDGQHRLMAFNQDDEIRGDFEVPVVAWFDLDVTWQAYLFYMINIKPKRINPSLAFDLYPILRMQDWLEAAPERAAIYRETRAQELTEVLWSHPESPWRGRISMLGDKREGPVTQAAFVRSLMTTYVKSGRGTPVGGLFGSPVDEAVPSWSRVQQSAFLLAVWRSVAEAVGESNAEWANMLRELSHGDNHDQPWDAAFTSQYSLFSTDQGVRGVLQITNDLTVMAYDSLNLDDWTDTRGLEEDEIDHDAVSAMVESITTSVIGQHLDELARALVEFDWRTSRTPNLPEEARVKQLAYRGGSGYKELRVRLLEHLSEHGSPRIKQLATMTQTAFGY